MSALDEVYLIGAMERRKHLVDQVEETTGGVVQAGPFTGMMIPVKAAWGDGDRAAKLLGMYETEIQPEIEAMINWAPKLVVNYGSAEGYYAIGMLRRLEDAIGLAIDPHPDAQQICASSAFMNGVSSRLKAFYGYDAGVEAMMDTYPKTAIICDCEGWEIHYLDPVKVPALKQAYIIVECHDFLRAGITDELIRRFAPTHSIANYLESGRNPNDSALLSTWPSLDRWLVISENRPCRMNWLTMRPKSRPGI